MEAGPVGESGKLIRQRYLVGTKLIETFSRGAFVLVCTYALPLEDAGRFGLAATIIGLLAFVLGYERYIDLQRQIAGRSSLAIRCRLAETLKFFGVHYAVVLPAVVVTLSLWGGWRPEQVATGVIVMIGEHLANLAYHAVLLDRRAFPLLLAATAKNAIQLLSVLALACWSPQTLDVSWVLNMWAVASIAYLLVAASLWLAWARQPLPAVLDQLPAQSPRQQYLASRLHFLVGIVAVVALQADRLVVGGTLSPLEIGIYFRNIALSALAIQLFNIISFNRLAPDIYRYSREGQLRRSSSVVWGEYLRFSSALVAVVGIALIVNHLLGQPAHRLGLEAGFLGLLTLAVLMRTAADYSGLLLLSVGGDRTLFRNQLSSVVLGTSGLWILASRFQLSGAFFGVLATPLLYLVMNRFSVLQRFRELQT